MILDCVICPTVKYFCNLSPFVFYLAMHHEENPFFFFAPAYLLYFWVQMVVPSLSALFSNPGWKVLGDHGPFLSTNLLY